MAENEEKVSTIQPDNNPEVENLRKQLSEAQQKIGEQSKELETQRQYVQDADRLATLITASPELTQGLKQQYQKMYGGGVVSESEESSQQSEKKSEKKGDAKMADPKVEELTRDVTELKKTTRAKMVKEFEDRAGISSLPEEDRKNIRRQIEEYVNTFGQSIRSAPVEVLDTVLDKAYKAVNVEKLVQEGKYEAMADVYTNQSGSIPHISGRKLDSEEDSGLTDGQKKWAERFNLDLDKVKVVNKNKDQEPVRTQDKE